MAIIASALGRTMAVAAERESTALGAAMLAARALGRSMAAGPAVEVAPDPALTAAYAELYARRWLPAFDRLLPLSERLARLAP